MVLISWLTRQLGVDSEFGQPASEAAGAAYIDYLGGELNKIIDVAHRLKQKEQSKKSKGGEDEYCLDVHGQHYCSRNFHFSSI